MMMDHFRKWASQYCRVRTEPFCIKPDNGMAVASRLVGQSLTMDLFSLYHVIIDYSGR